MLCTLLDCDRSHRQWRLQGTGHCIRVAQAPQHDRYPQYRGGPSERLEHVELGVQSQISHHLDVVVRFMFLVQQLLIVCRIALGVSVMWLTLLSMKKRLPLPHGWNVKVPVPVTAIRLAGQCFRGKQLLPMHRGC